MTAATAFVDRDDVQGLLARGYGRLPHATYCLFSVERASAARALLGVLAETVGTAAGASGGPVRNVALTAAGLEVLGLPAATVAAFGAPFSEGMVTAHRSRLLGDTGENDPSTWEWGGPRRDPVHVLVLLYAEDRPSLDAGLAALDRECAGALRSVARHSTDVLGPEEPFGFADGISQPRVAGLGPDPGGLPTGEFVLGHRNAYGLRTWRPLLPASADPEGLLAPDPAGTGTRDLGHGGSFLVHRQLEQDVDAFWGYARRRTARPDGKPDPVAAERLAARMVGRWRSGAPLVLSAERDDPGRRGDDFGYRDDAAGLRCPRGAHIRRVNPRDALEPAMSREIVDRHRVLRRGRTYTAPAGDGHGPLRGLHFLCLGANIARQYEFVQHTWINDPHFDGLRDDADPLVAPRRERGNTFTEQARPVRRRHPGLPAFVRVRGGAYFFLPGRRALRFLAAQG